MTKQRTGASKLENTKCSGVIKHWMKHGASEEGAEREEQGQKRRLKLTEEERITGVIN